MDSGKYQRKPGSLQLLLPNPWRCLLGAERCSAMAKLQEIFVICRDL
jgi:hypothetical protein